MAEHHLAENSFHCPDAFLLCTLATSSARCNAHHAALKCEPAIPDVCYEDGRIQSDVVHALTDGVACIECRPRRGAVQYPRGSVLLHSSGFEALQR